MKNTLKFLSLIVLVLSASILLSACGNKTNTTVQQGTYYLYSYTINNQEILNQSGQVIVYDIKEDNTYEYKTISADENNWVIEASGSYTNNSSIVNFENNGQSKEYSFNNEDGFLTLTRDVNGDEHKETLKKFDYTYLDDSYVMSNKQVNNVSVGVQEGENVLFNFYEDGTFELYNYYQQTGSSLKGNYYILEHNFVLVDENGVENAILYNYYYEAGNVLLSYYDETTLYNNIFEPLTGNSLLAGNYYMQSGTVNTEDIGYDFHATFEFADYGNDERLYNFLFIAGQETSSDSGQWQVVGNLIILTDEMYPDWMEIYSYTYDGENTITLNYTDQDGTIVYVCTKYTPVSLVNEYNYSDYFVNGIHDGIDEGTSQVIKLFEDYTYEITTTTLQNGTSTEYGYYEHYGNFMVMSTSMTFETFTLYEYNFNGLQLTLVYETETDTQMYIYDVIESSSN